MSDPNPIEVLLTYIGQFITGAFGWVASVVTTVTSNPLILCAVLVPFVGLGVGLLKRLLSARA